MQILSGLGLTFLSPSCVSLSIPLESFKLFQAHMSHLPSILLVGIRKCISLLLLPLCVNRKVQGFGVKEPWVELQLTTY